MDSLKTDEIRRAVRDALSEDIGTGDATTLATVPRAATLQVVMRARAPLVLAGLAFAETAFRKLAPSVKVKRRARDGQRVKAGGILLEISGPARAILSAERVALNFVQRLSGVATLTGRFVDAVEGTGAEILDTRKTTPGWRRFEKYAVACGGGRNHRIGLYDMVLIKDNHLAALREEEPNVIAAAVRRARARFPKLKVEVEADTLRQVEQAVEAGADIILLDNMRPALLRRAVKLAGRQVKTEASGGVNLKTVRAIAMTGVDFISVGALTHSAPAVDIGLDFEDLIATMTTDAQILSALRAAGDAGGVSGAELSQRLGISRAAIWARIEELRQLGYDIEASPHLGYRLVNDPDVLHADDLLARLGRTRVIGRDVQVFEQTTSTNDVVEKLARDGVAEGAVVFAESQTKGRGRLGRKWMSPARKGLWFSLLLRPNLSPQETTQIMVMAATALRRAIHDRTGLRAEIKWPNDILIDGKKVAGILTEMRAEVDRVKYVILGIGLDVNLGAGEFPAELRKIATSLRIESGAALSRAEMATAVLHELDHDYTRVCGGRFAAVADEWEQHCTTIGRNVTIQVGGRKISGCAESLDDDGALLLRTEHGHLERIMGGDVTLEK